MASTSFTATPSSHLSLPELSLLRLRVFPDPVLALQAQPVTKPLSPALVASMFDAMIEHEGVGLAACQVGLRQDFFVAFEDLVCCNPRQVKVSDKLDSCVEGCLSLPSQQFEILRPTWVKIRFDDPFTLRSRTMKFVGFNAQVVCHEMDHLRGLTLKDTAVRLAPHSESPESGL